MISNRNTIEQFQLIELLFTIQFINFQCDQLNTYDFSQFHQLFSFKLIVILRFEIINKVKLIIFIKIISKPTMMNPLLRRLSHSYMHSSSLKTQILQKPVYDVVVLQGMPPSNESISTSIPYIYIDKTKIQLPASLSMSHLHQELSKIAINPLFYDLEFNIYMANYPLIALLGSRQPFYFAINNQMYYVITDSPICAKPTSSEYIATEGPPQLQPVARALLKDLSNKEYISGAALQALLLQGFIKKTDQLKAEKLRLKELKKLVSQKLSEFQSQINQISAKIAAKNQKRVKWFCGFLIGQFAVLHYLIYFNLSWDILEPITVILGNFDIFCAYFFFLTSSKQFSLETMQTSLLGRTIQKHLKKQGVDMRKYEELQLALNWIELRLTLMSKNEVVVKSMCDQKWGPLDIN